MPFSPFLFSRCSHHDSCHLYYSALAACCRHYWHSCSPFSAALALVYTFSIILAPSLPSTLFIHMHLPLLLCAPILSFLLTSSPLCSLLVFFVVALLVGSAPPPASARVHSHIFLFSARLAARSHNLVALPCW